MSKRRFNTEGAAIKLGKLSADWYTREIMSAIGVRPVEMLQRHLMCDWGEWRGDGRASITAKNMAAMSAGEGLVWSQFNWVTGHKGKRKRYEMAVSTDVATGATHITSCDDVDPSIKPKEM